MRSSVVALLVLGVALSCGESMKPETSVIHARRAPDAHALQALEDRIAGLTLPIVGDDGDKLERLAATAAIEPPAKLERTGKPGALETPPRDEPIEDPYAELDDDEPFEAPLVFPPLRPWSAARLPLAPRADSAPPAPDTSALVVARNVAVGVGGAGLLVSAASIAIDLDSASKRGEMVGGVALGVGFLGLVTAGILTLAEASQEDASLKVRVSASASGLELSF